MRHGVAPVPGQRDQEGEDRGAEGGSLGATETWEKEEEKRQKGWEWASKDMGGKKGRSREEGRGTVG